MDKHTWLDSSHTLVKSRIDERKFNSHFQSIKLSYSKPMWKGSGMSSNIRCNKSRRLLVWLESLGFHNLPQADYPGQDPSFLVCILWKLSMDKWYLPWDPYVQCCCGDSGLHFPRFVGYSEKHLPHCRILGPQCPQTALLPSPWVNKLWLPSTVLWLQNQNWTC